MEDMNRNGARADIIRRVLENNTVLDLYQRASQAHVDTENRGVPWSVYTAMALCEEAGEVAGKVKKMLRNDGGKLSPEQRVARIQELGDVLWYLTAHAKDLGSSLEEVARMNLEKVLDRCERNVVCSTGDSR